MDAFVDPLTFEDLASQEPRLTRIIHDRQRGTDLVSVWVLIKRTQEEVPRMTQSATAPLVFAPPARLPLAVDFEGGRLTCDGGWAWVAAADAALGLCAARAAVIPALRRRCGRHTGLELLRQRLSQIVAGDEDQNDAATLRTDPQLKLVCGRLPEPDPDLASQPTVSRWENRFSARDSDRLAVAMGEISLRERERDVMPTRIVLDLDGTDNPTHGQREGSAYHGSYRQHMLHSLLVFAGTTGLLITAGLRPGNAHGSADVVAVLKQVVRRLRERWPEVRIEVRMDSAGAVPALSDWCELASPIASASSPLRG